VVLVFFVVCCRAVTNKILLAGVDCDALTKSAALAMVYPFLKVVMFYQLPILKKKLHQEKFPFS